MHWYFEVLRNYANFRGRARRREYWIFALINSLIANFAEIGHVFGEIGHPLQWRWT